MEAGVAKSVYKVGYELDDGSSIPNRGNDVFLFGDKAAEA